MLSKTARQINPMFPERIAAALPRGTREAVKVAAERAGLAPGAGKNGKKRKRRADAEACSRVHARATSQLSRFLWQKALQITLENSNCIRAFVE
jgi:hypothetical protein